MRKLRLDLDLLTVESFEAAEDADGAGTVNGHIKMPPAEPVSFDPCEPGSGSCGASCYGTCGESCYGTCGATCGASCNGTCYQTCAGYTCGGSCNPLARCAPPHQYPPLVEY